MATMALTKDTKFDNKRTKEKETNILKILSQIQNEKKKSRLSPDYSLVSLHISLVGPVSASIYSSNVL